MSLTAAQLAIKVVADTTGATQGLKGISSEVDKAKGKLPGFLNMFSGMLSANIVSNALGQTFNFVTGQIGDMIDAGEQANIVQDQTAQFLKSTKDASGQTAKSINDLATALMNQTGISDDTIQSTENMLLTFTNIHSNVFPATTQAALDLSAGLTKIGTDTSPQQAALLLGKALDDPVAGMTALQRAGVKLSDTQKEQVKHFMDVGDTADAQKLILSRVNQEFGGQAAAIGKANGGMAIMKARLDEAKQSMGQALLPVIEKLEQTALPLITVALNKVSDALSWVSTHGDQLKPVAIVLGTVLGVVVVGALGAATVAAWSFTAALLANPITWIAVGIVAAIAGIILVVKNWGAITNWIHKTIGHVVAAIHGFFIGLGHRISDFVSGVVTWFQQLPDKIKQAGIDMINGFIDGIKSLAGSVAHALGDVIRGAVNALPGGKQLAHLAGIPGFAAGGVTPGGPVVVGENGPELLMPPAGSRVIPLSGRGGVSSGASGQVVQHITILLDGQVLARSTVANMPNVIRIGTGLRSW